MQSNVAGTDARTRHARQAFPVDRRRPPDALGRHRCAFRAQRMEAIGQ